MSIAIKRQSHHPIEPLFLERWSTRAFNGAALDEARIASLFEAARWAPSAFNAQPWRFLYARRDSEDWLRFLDLLLPFNQSWAERAALLVFVLSETLIQAKPESERTPSHSHSFDAGAAWALLALQATSLGLHAHAMTGIDFDRARDELELPPTLRIEAAIAIGEPGDALHLSEALRAREVLSDRRPVASFAFAGRLPAA